MENGEGDEEGKSVERKMADLALSNLDDIDHNNGDDFFQVIKAVEAAEATIKKQDSGYLKAHSPHSVDHLDNLADEFQRQMELDNQTDRTSHPDNIHEHQFSNSIVPKKNLMQTDEYHAVLARDGTPATSNMVVGSPLRILPGGQATSDSIAYTQLLTPLTATPIRYYADGESDTQLTVSGRGLMPISEVNFKNLKQDLGFKIQEHEEEITQLRKHLAEYSVNEAKLLDDKHNLEKRVSHMRIIFDQQQQDLVDAAVRSVSYRQDIIEENIRLAYALQAVQQQRSTFISSLMPLLAQYSLDPPVVDAQSVVSNVKVLFRHLHEKLLFTEEKLKASQYQFSPQRPDMAAANVTQSQYHETNDGLELVLQPQYQDANPPASPITRATTGWDLLSHHDDEFGIGVAKTSEPHDFLNASSHDETNSKRFNFGKLVRNIQLNDSDMERHQTDAGPSTTWAPETSPYTTAEEPSSPYAPYLPVVPEERSSSVSEAADDDPLPAIEGLQISGEAFPGRQLQAGGYSTNGTAICNFEWVRHREDGSFNYIEGAKQPYYLVTADDVDTYLSIEIQPLDNSRRKGELVTVFANHHNKITCDPEMKNCINRTYDSGQASYRVSLSVGHIKTWDPATLSIKKDSYSIKCSGSSGVVVSEKYSQSTIVSIPFGSRTEFSIIDSRGDEHCLQAQADSTEVKSCRDTIVLSLRLFIIRANSQKKSKKKGFFFIK